jgi:hypothetical protein
MAPPGVAVVRLEDLLPSEGYASEAYTQAVRSSAVASTRARRRPQKRAGRTALTDALRCARADGQRGGVAARQRRAHPHAA